MWAPKPLLAGNEELFLELELEGEVEGDEQTRKKQSGKGADSNLPPAAALAPADVRYSWRLCSVWLAGVTDAVLSHAALTSPPLESSAGRTSYCWPVEGASTSPPGASSPAACLPMLVT